MPEVLLLSTGPNGARRSSSDNAMLAFHCLFKQVVLWRMSYVEIA